MQFERIPNARLQRFLTDVYTHRLTATISVYPAKFTKTGSERRHFSIECNYGRTRAHRQGRQTANRGPYHYSSERSEIHNVLLCYAHN